MRNVSSAKPQALFPSLLLDKENLASQKTSKAQHITPFSTLKQCTLSPLWNGNTTNVFLRWNQHIWRERIDQGTWFWMAQRQYVSFSICSCVSSFSICGSSFVVFFIFAFYCNMEEIDISITAMIYHQQTCNYLTMLEEKSRKQLLRCEYQNI